MNKGESERGSPLLFLRYDAVAIALWVSDRSSVASSLIDAGPRRVNNNSYACFNRMQ